MGAWIVPTSISPSPQSSELLSGVSVDKVFFQSKIPSEAEVAEQADALRSGRSGLYARVGSTPTFGIR